MIDLRVSWGLVLTLLISSAFGASWRFSNPRPHGNHILDLVIHDGVVWQIGDRGQIYTSIDLDHWIPKESGTTKSLRGITFSGGKAYISAEEGTIISGTADSLTVQSLETADWLEGIAASDNTLVAVGDNGAIYSSSNGSDWIRHGNYTNWLRSVAFGKGTFVCVGEDGFLALSSDGLNWQRQIQSTTAHLNKAAWIEDRFWIVGDDGTVLTNNSRMTFSRVSLAQTNDLFAVAGTTNEIVIAGHGLVLLGNLRTGAWTEQSDPGSPALAPVWPYYSALWDGRLFLLGGRTGLTVEGFRTNEFAPLTWFSDVQPTRSWLWSVTRTPGFYAAVGASGTIVTSEDGVEWARESVPSAALNQVLLGIGGNTNVLVAVGTEGTLLRSENTYTNVVSTNSMGQIETNSVSLFGLIWSQVASPSAVDLQGVAADDNMFVVTGANGQIFSSTNGGWNWQPRPSGVTSFLSGVTAWPAGFVAVGSSGVILTSGSIWRRENSGVQDWIYSVRYAGGKLVAVGENGLILTSENGVQWQRRHSGTMEWLNDLSFAQGKWYIVSSGGLILSSIDSVEWTIERAITSKSFYSIASDGEQLITVGLEGVILRKYLLPATTPVQFLTYDNLAETSLFLFSGMIDQQFVLEQKTSLNEQWTRVTNLEIVQPGGTVIYEVPNAGAPARFFRVRLR